VVVGLRPLPVVEGGNGVVVVVGVVMVVIAGGNLVLQ